MTSRRRRKAIPLGKVDLPKEEVEVYKVQDCCQMKVTVEALRRKIGPGQCYRCQQFGHSQLCCRGAVRCVRCAGAHRPSECQVPTSQPPSAQTAGDHTPQVMEAAQEDQARPKDRGEGHSYARVAQPQREEETRSQEETENQVLQQLLATEKRGIMNLIMQHPIAKQKYEAIRSRMDRTN
nr:unnamed protein product [Callosobruchus chinensis]